MGKTFYVKTNLEGCVYKAISDISKYDDETKQQLSDVVQEKTDEIFTEAVHGVKIHTGNLAAGIEHSYDLTPEHATGKVVAKAPHSHLIEYGHRGGLVIPIRKKALAPGGDGWFMAHAVIPGQPAHPFMGPAADKVRPSLEAAVKEAVDHDT
jgi:hypothetical protein